jgi:hypothetical protein
MASNFTPKNAEILFCDLCDFKCSKHSDFTRHLMTRKHQTTYKKLTNTDIFKQKNALAENNIVCMCGKSYKHRQSLNKHKKTCSPKSNKETNVIQDEQKEDLIQLIMKENSDFKNLILEVCKNFQSSTVTNMHNSHNNSHNKTFNLQVFLNETCKDAMNIMDFADSIKLQLTDLENVGEQGFVNGISNIIIKNLQEMDVNLRPVHCSDLKREVAYVKENGKWEKDTPDNKLIKKAIKRIAHRNVKQIPEWRDKYPDCRFSDSKKSDQYNELIIEAMGGRGDNDAEKANKIVKKIIKNVVIDKNML